MADIHYTTGEAPINGTRFSYEIAGEGYPLVLVHAGIADIIGTAHFPNLERTAEFNRLVLDFLATV